MKIVRQKARMRVQGNVYHEIEISKKKWVVLMCFFPQFSSSLDNLLLIYIEV